MTRADQLGSGALRLLAEGWMVSVLRALVAGASRPAELERYLPLAGHGVLIRRLHRLVEHRLAHREHHSGVPPHPPAPGVGPLARYTMTEAGLRLIDVADTAAHWEGRWFSMIERAEEPGTRAIRHLADRRTRDILLLLADAPRSAEALEVEISDLGRSALRRRLRELVLGGLLQSARAAGERRFAMTPAARNLSAVALMAARWEWRWERPEHPSPGEDLRNLLKTLAPAAGVQPSMAGTCRVQLGTDAEQTPEIYLEVRDGAIRALSTAAPGQSASVIARGSPEAWCELLLNPEAPICATGDRELLEEVIRALSASMTLPQA